MKYRRRLLYVSAMTLCSACASVKQYGMKDAEGHPADMIATRTTPLWGHADLTLKGGLRGKLQASGDLPNTIKIEFSLALPGEQQPSNMTEWQPVAINSDGSFVQQIEKTFDLRDQGDVSALPVRFRFPWKEELEATGRGIQATPDKAEYIFKFLSDGSLQLQTSSGAVVQALSIPVSFKNVEDKARLKALADQSRLERIRVQKERAQEKRLEARERRERQEAQETFAREVSTCRMLYHNKVESGEPWSEFALQSWADNHCVRHAVIGN